MNCAKILSLLLLCTLSPASLAGSAEADESLRVFSKMAKHLKALGMLNYCGKDGLSKALQERLIPAIMLHGAPATLDKATGFATTNRLYGEAQLYIVGVSDGLQLIDSPESKERICSLASTAADEVLAQPIAPPPKSGP